MWDDLVSWGHLKWDFSGATRKKGEETLKKIIIFLNIRKFICYLYHLEKKEKRKNKKKYINVGKHTNTI